MWKIGNPNDNKKENLFVISYVLAYQEKEEQSKGSGEFHV